MSNKLNHIYQFIPHVANGNIPFLGHFYEFLDIIILKFVSSLFCNPFLQEQNAQQSKHKHVRKIYNTSETYILQKAKLDDLSSCTYNIQKCFNSMDPTDYMVSQPRSPQQTGHHVCCCRVYHFCIVFCKIYISKPCVNKE